MFRLWIPCLTLLVGAHATILFDGRLGANYTAEDLEASNGPFLRCVYTLAIVSIWTYPSSLL